ncbi:flagellar assembly protein FliW [Paenibacillus tarimensis]
MEVQTSRFGELNVMEKELYTFPKGIPGFEDQTSFIIVAPEEDRPFAFLQSAANPELVFVIADPFLFYPDYDFEIPEPVLTELNIESSDQVLVRSIINTSNGLEAATINLVAPILFNAEAQLGKQVVFGKSPYTTKQPLFVAAD